MEHLCHKFFHTQYQKTHLWETIIYQNCIFVNTIDLLPEKLPQAIKRKKNDMNGTPLPQIFSYRIS